MAVMSGADADQLDDLGHRMTQAADLLDAIRHEVSAALGRAAWEGDDAADFHGLWHHRLAGLLQSTTSATRDASTRLHRNAAEQRRASATDAAAPAAVPSQRPGGFGLGDAWDWASLAAGTVTWGFDGLDRFRDIREIGKIADSRLIQGLTKDRWLFGLGDDATGLKGLVHAADKAGPLALIGAGVDGYKLGSALAQGSTRDKIDASVDVGFDIAEAAAIGFPPAEFGIAGAHLAFDAYEMLPDNVHHAVEGAVVNAAKDVVRAHVEVVEAGAHVAGSIVSGGVHAAKKLFGF